MNSETVEWSNSPNLRALKEILNQDPAPSLVLVLGSGVNGTLVPQWDNLIRELFLSTLMNTIEDEKVFNSVVDEIKTNFDVYARASLLKNILGHSFHGSLRNIIYKNVNIDELIKYCGNSNPVKDGRFDLIKSVAKLCQNKRILAVITYNYDNLLETAMNSVLNKSRIPVSVRGRYPRFEFDLDKLRIYHVHGFIPHFETIETDKNKKFVMAMDQYCSFFNEPMAWETSTQLHFLHHYPVLFIGTSLNDWNILRLLHESREHRLNSYGYCIAKTITCESSKLSEREKRLCSDQINLLRSDLWRSVGINPIYVNEFDDIPFVINSVDQCLDQVNHRPKPNQ